MLRNYTFKERQKRRIFLGTHTISSSGYLQNIGDLPFQSEMVRVHIELSKLRPCKLQSVWCFRLIYSLIHYYCRLSCGVVNSRINVVFTRNERLNQFWMSWSKIHNHSNCRTVAHLPKLWSGSSPNTLPR